MSELALLSLHISLLALCYHMAITTLCPNVMSIHVRISIIIISCFIISIMLSRCNHNLCPNLMSNHVRFSINYHSCFIISIMLSHCNHTFMSEHHGKPLQSQFYVRTTCQTMSDSVLIIIHVSLLVLCHHIAITT
jgi:hypothetical protein